MTAEVEKAFVIISVDNHDCDVLRFLWVVDISKSDPKIQVFRFTLVVFRVSSSPLMQLLIRELPKEQGGGCAMSSQLHLC